MPLISAILQGAPLVSVGSVANLAGDDALGSARNQEAGATCWAKLLGISRHGSTTHYLTLVALEKLGLARTRSSCQALAALPKPMPRFAQG